MKNLTMSVDGSVLTVKIDLKQTQGPSKTGKTQVIATTNGFLTVDGGTGKEIISINCNLKV